VGERMFDVSAHVYAHRGFWGGAVPENSLAAFGAAAGAGVGCELDARLTRDGALVVFHDATLDRLCNEGVRLDALTLADVRQRRLPDGSTIPTLAEALTAMAGQPVLIEIKVDGPGTEAGRFMADAVAQLLSDHPGCATAMSFDEPTVARLCQVIPDRPVGLLIDGPERLGAEEVVRKAATGRTMGCDYLGPHVTALETIAAAAGGLPLVTWTVRTADDLRLARRHSAAPIFEGIGPALAMSGGTPI
jgi:glycerophosphoryl diester phosphodiesterase